MVLQYVLSSHKRLAVSLARSRRVNHWKNSSNYWWNGN